MANKCVPLIFLMLIAARWDHNLAAKAEASQEKSIAKGIPFFSRPKASLV